MEGTEAEAPAPVEEEEEEGEAASNSGSNIEEAGDNGGNAVEEGGGGPPEEEEEETSVAGEGGPEEEETISVAKEKPEEEVKERKNAAEIAARSHKRSSSKRESAKKKRSSHRRRNFTTSITNVIDSMVFGGTLSRRKRTRSAERHSTDSPSSSASGGGASRHSCSRDKVRPDSGYAEDDADEHQQQHSTRRHSDVVSTSPPVSPSAFKAMSLDCPEEGSADEEEEEGARQQKEKGDQDWYFNRAKSKLKELRDTEHSYVEGSLKEVVEGYQAYMEGTVKEVARMRQEDKDENHPRTESAAAWVAVPGRVRVPADLLGGGKYRIVFGNIMDIYDFHVRSIMPELDKCVEDPSSLRTLFEGARDRMKQKYGRFCLNKPKSEYIITQYENKYFTVLRLKNGFHKSLSSQMMTPIQRVTRYTLLLREIEKDLARSGRAELHQDVAKAYEVAADIADYANSMMITGRISGYPDNVTSQGLLLKRGRAQCFKKKHLPPRKHQVRRCQVFVFQETILLCEEPYSYDETGYPQNLEYLTSFKTNKVTAREFQRGDSSFGFELEKTPERSSGSSSAAGPMTPISPVPSTPLSPLSRKPSSPFSSSSSSTPPPSPQEEAWSSVVVQFATEQERDDFLRVVNGQIRQIANYSKFLENPKLHMMAQGVGTEAEKTLGLI